MVKIKVYLNSPSPFSITFKNVNKFDIQNLVTGNLLSQVNANQLTDQLAKNILGKGEHLKIRARLDALRNNTFTGGDDNVDGRRGGSGSYRHNFQKKKSQKQQSLPPPELPPLPLIALTTNLRPPTAPPPSTSK